MSFRITGTGSCVPAATVSNDMLSGMLNTSDEWIRQRVGIKNRHVCTVETVTDLAVSAAKSALENAGIVAGELDLIIASTVSSESITPSLSCMIQKEIGASCMAFDVNAACSSFLFLLETAKAYLSMGMKRILLVSGEQMSRMVDWTDRSIAVLFGDGAGAAVVEKDDCNLYSSVFSVTGNNDVIRIQMPYGNSPFKNTDKPEKPMLLEMKGQETFKYAVNAMCTNVNQVLEKTGLTVRDIKYIVPHQANQRILNLTAEKLGIPIEKIYSVIEEYGNTSSASIPIALDIMNRNKLLQKGDLVIFCAFGGGLSSGAVIIKWTR